MTAVRLGESAKYGARLYGYLLGVTLLGGTGLVLGAALAWPELQAWRGPGQADPTAAAAGGLLLFLGVTVIFIGYLGAAYKLIADANRMGRGPAVDAEGGDLPREADARASADDPTADADEATDVGPTRAPGIEPESSPTTDRSAAGDDADAVEAAGTADESTGGADTGPSRTEDPPEPSPSEIAFGTSSDGDSSWGDRGSASADSSAPDEESAESYGDETVADSAGGSITPAARDAPSDPLADPTEDE